MTDTTPEGMPALPFHPEPHSMKWSKLEERAIAAYGLAYYQAGRAAGLEEAYNAMFDIRGDKVTRFNAQTAIRAMKDKK